MSSVEEYLEAQRQHRIKLEQLCDKYERNAKLIHKLDLFYRLKLAYPYSDDATLLEFWSDKNPNQLASFRDLLKKNKKTYKVQQVGPSDFWIEIDDRRRG